MTQDIRWEQRPYQIDPSLFGSLANPDLRD